MNLKLRALVGACHAALIASACGSSGSTTGPSAAVPTPGQSCGGEAAPSAATPAASLDTTPVTIKVWDYYGESTPIKPALAGFAKEFPWITVDYEALDWDSMNEKFTAGIGAGEVPDMATLDMTWLPTLAANGALEDLDGLSGGQLNGTPIADQYTKGAQDAMHFGDQMVAMLYDFDTYALYYRKDLFDQKGIAVPKNWDELRAAAKQLAEASKAGGKNDKYLTVIRPNSFHFSQYLYQDGGALLNDDNTQAVFNSTAGVNAVNIQKAILDDGTGLYWPDANNDLIPVIKSGQVGHVPGRAVLHGPAQDRRARAVRQVGGRDGAVLQAARELPRRHRSRHPGPGPAQGSRLAVHPVPAPARERDWRVHLRRCGAGHDGRPPEHRADEAGSVLRRRAAVLGSSSNRWPRHARSRTSVRGPRSTRRSASRWRRSLLTKADVQQTLDDAVNQVNALLKQ